MSWIANVDWNKLFTPDAPLLEMFVRGSIVYLALFVMLRVVLQRQAGTVGVTDLLVVVLIADAAQNAMAGTYNSITSGLVLVATIIFWDYALDWLAYRFRWVHRFVHPPPLVLVKDGKILHRNMRRELITRDELMSQLREQGVSELANVREACMEGDGKISVVSAKEESHPKPEKTLG